MDLIPNDWKHLFKTETSKKSLLKSFYYNNKGITKVKDFQNLSHKEIYFIFQSNSTKYNKPFKFISWSNFLEGHHILSPEIWLKLLLIDLTNALMDIYFLTLQCIERLAHQILCVPHIKSYLTLSVILSLYRY